MKKYSRIFVIVMDSLGIGHAKDAFKFHQVGNVSDEGANTFKHIADNYPTVLNIPTLESLGILKLFGVLSIDNTSILFLSNSLINALPTKPLPPVTITFIYYTSTH